MSKLTLQGTIKVIYDTQTFDSGFQKREFVLTTLDTYPQDVKLEVVKDKCALLDTYAVGSSVEVAFNVKGSMWNEKYFVNLQAWSINPTQGNEVAEPSMVGGESDIDNLPF